MNVPQKDLDLWRRFFDTLRVSMRSACSDLAAGNTNAARHTLEQTEDAARRMALRLEQAGAQRPEGHQPPPEVPLHLLNTPANRRYVETLHAAWEAGKAVDRERFGADIGTDGPAQAVERLLAEAEEELHGPVGSGRE